jgi:hypothetical protein
MTWKLSIHKSIPTLEEVNLLSYIEERKTTSLKGVTQAEATE